MPAGEVALLAWTDYVGITRCRGIPVDDLPARWANGVGWAVAGASLTPFSDIADNPWGPMAEVRQVPDPAAEVRIAVGTTTPPLHMVLCDARESDGRPWDCCPRQYLRTALEDLRSIAGVEFVGAFEHEFLLSGASLPDAPAFSVQTMRNADAFVADLARGLIDAGLSPETIEPEYGVRQFEIATRPAVGLAAADNAIFTRHIVQEVARFHGLRASFSPKPRPDGVGNGCHVHFSFSAPDGTNATFDAAGPGGTSRLAQNFIGGVIRHMPALTALVAPSPVSYLRLGPQHWSCGFVSFGIQNREAALRVCPSTDPDPVRRASGFNIEFRPPDATANLYLILGSLIRAGLVGIAENLDMPRALDRDPAELDDAERVEYGVTPLPASLDDALRIFAGDPVASAWMPPMMLESYLSVKRAEIARVSGMTPDEVCALYGSVY